jgi:HEAT repeat protein
VRLRDKKSPRSRTLAAECLRLIRPSDARAVEALAAVVKEDERNEPRVQSAAALGAIGAPAAAAVPALVAALTEKKPDLRAAASAALGQIGAGAKAAVGPLAERIKDKEEEDEVRQAAREALKKIDPKAVVP